MDQTNPLAELTHKRRLSALGPGGLQPRPRRLRRARRAPQPLRPHLPDRDAGRPEHRSDRLAGDLRPRSTSTASSRRRTAGCCAQCRERPDAADRPDRCASDLKSDDGKVVAKAGTRSTTKLAEQIGKLPASSAIDVKPFVTDEIRYLTADEEERYIVAQANVAR